jgi:hypothetical protein
MKESPALLGAVNVEHAKVEPPVTATIKSIFLFLFITVDPPPVATNRSLISPVAPHQQFNRFAAP